MLIARPSLAHSSPSAKVPPAQLAEAWRTRRIVEVEGSHLASAVSALISHHVENGFLPIAWPDMRLHKGLGSDGSLELQVRPRFATKPESPGSCPAHGCVLCSPPDAREKALAWRNFVIWPNAFPYGNSFLEHVVITARDHRGQLELIRGELADMIEYQRAARAGRPLHLAFNGIIGNSQFHQHWHGLRDVLPLERHIDGGRVKLTRVAESSSGRTDAFDGALFTGILVRGNAAYVSRQGFRLARFLMRHPKTQGAFNMHLINPKDGEARLVILPRRVIPIVQDESWGISSVPAAGRFLMTVPLRTSVAEAAREREARLRHVLMRPAELGLRRDGDLGAE